MKELVEYIAKALVEDKDAVKVNENRRDKNVLLELSVAQADMGKVIGKQGRIARSIRTVLKAYATKNGEKANLDIL